MKKIIFSVILLIVLFTAFKLINYKNMNTQSTDIKHAVTNPLLFKEVQGVVMYKNFTKEIKDAKIKKLTPLQVKVTQHEGTEPSHDNLYDKNWEKGIYVDIVSGEPLYLSTDKFDSGTGWPSFTQPISPDFLTLKTDNYLFYSRTEVRSKIADSHLGHVFPDGPAERGGMRYCMNSAALNFVPLTDMERSGYGEYISQIK